MYGDLEYLLLLQYPLYSLSLIFMKNHAEFNLASLV